MKLGKYSVFVVFIILFVSVLSPSMVNAKTSNANSTKANPAPKASFAYSTINITLDNNGIIYERNTDLRAPVGWNASINLFSAVMTLTTHGDTLLDIEVQYSTQSFQNFQDFNQSKYHYRYDYQLLSKIVQIPISLLGIKSEAFLLKSSQVYNPITKQYDREYILSQQVVFSETTAFISALNEPFKFDSNFIQMGSLQDFNFRVIYQKTTINGKVTELYHEDLKLVSTGSPLSYVSGTEGYQGDIYFTDHQPQPLGNFPRQDVNQTIVYKFILPSDQSIHLSYDPVFSTSQSSTSFAKISGNTFSLTFNSSDLMPYYISLTSDTPIFLQFSITDYASWALALLTGLFAVLRGIPFYLRRRGTRGTLKNLRKLALQQNTEAISKELEQAHSKFIKGKISLNQYNAIKDESEVLLKNN